MTATIDRVPLSEAEFLDGVVRCARLRRDTAGLLLRLQLQLATVNYDRRRRGLPVHYGWAHLADTAVSARMWCGDQPGRRRPF